MQADVRELVLGYLRAKGVPFGWQQGTVVVPDTSKIRAAASGRPELRLTFDRDLAQAIDGVDYVTFGHPVFEQIREELRRVPAYCERYWGSDQVDENQPPHVRWGSSVPTISAATRTWDELLVVRFQLDVVSDFRHQETFAVVVDLETGKVAPEKARLCQHSPRSLPPGFAPALPRVPLDAAVEAAKGFANERRSAIVEALRVENAQRVAADLEKAAQGDQDAAATEHLRRELLAKARLQAALRLLAIERWFVERELVYSVRVPGWSSSLQAADAVHEPATGRTTLRGWSLTASAAAPLLVHLCDHEHPTLETPASCGSCGRQFCPTHLGRCDLTGDTTCLNDLAPCAEGGHPGHVRRSLLVEVAEAGGLTCPSHRATCSVCSRVLRATALASSPCSDGALCGICRIECGDCGVLLRKDGAPRCSRTEVALCPAHATRCPACTKTIRQSLAVEVAGGAYCPEHVFSCSDGHRALTDARVTCVETAVELCRSHALGCVECGAPLSSKAARRSASSQEPLCRGCARECAQCQRPFRPVEVVACARSKAIVCSDCRVTCDMAECGQVVSRDQTVELDGRRVCVAHTFVCAMGHPAWLESQVRCQASGRALCTTHVVRCGACESEVAVDQVVPSAETARQLCPACRGACSTCWLNLERASLATCALSGVLLCQTHRSECAGCHRTVASDAVLPSGLTQALLCPGCRGVCAQCGLVVETTALANDHETGESVCSSCATPCATCARLLRLDRSVLVDDARHCPAHVATCAEGHPMLAAGQVQCAATAKPYCPRHVATCDHCGKTVAASLVLPTKDTGVRLCPECGASCADCSGYFVRSSLLACGVVRELACPACRMTCVHEACARPLRRAVAVEIDGRFVCPEHVVDCIGHRTTRDRAVDCARSGRPRCASHVVRCTVCARSIGSDVATTSGVSGTTMCRACAVSCAVCEAECAPAEAQAEFDTHDLLCPACLRVCAEADCGRHLRSSRATRLDDQRDYCQDHVFSCAEGHEAPTSVRLTCATSGRAVCVAHAVRCATCDAPVRAGLELRSAETSAALCSTCGGLCAACTRPFERATLTPCGLTEVPICSACRAQCEHDRCGRVIRRSVGVEIDGRLVCPEHVLDCIGHRTTRDRAVDCGRTGRPRCAAHVARCAACDRTVGSDVATASKASGVALCRGCAVTCGACKESFAPNEVELEFDTEAKLCKTCDRVCAADGCGRHIRAVRVTRLEDHHDYCPDHVFRCEKGHAAATSARLTCAVTKSPVCREHVVPCAGCAAPILVGAELRSKATSLPLCSACGATCAGCSSAFERSLLLPCARSGHLYCGDDRLACAHRDCGLTVGRAEALEVDGRLVCREHVVLCDSRHPATHDTAARCAITGAWICQAHALRCSDCAAVAAPRGTVKCAATGDALCTRCAVKCAECKRSFRKDKTVRCERSGETVCEADARRCEAPGCGRRIWRGLAREVGGRTVCPQHLFQCFAGHPALIEERRTCVVSGKAGCPVHLLECSTCASTFAPEHGQRRGHGNYCPRCVGRCFECQRALPPGELMACMRSGKQVCSTHAVVCSHAGCGKRIRSALAVTIAGRAQCKEHLARCSLDAGHVALDEDLHECPGDPGHEQTCALRICPRPEHACFKCKRPVCPTHLRKALGEPRPRYCAECLAALPRCQTCTMPLAKAAAMCPPCATLASKPLDTASGPPREVLDQCRLEFSKYGAWRHASFGDAEVWEREVRFGSVRIARLGKNPGVYEKRLGPISAVRRWLSGG